MSISGPLKIFNELIQEAAEYGLGVDDFEIIPGDDNEAALEAMCVCRDHVRLQLIGFIEKYSTILQLLIKAEAKDRKKPAVVSDDENYQYIDVRDHPLVKALRGE